LVILAGIAIGLLSLYIQIRPRLKKRHFGVDGWRHLLIADYIRRYKKYPHHMDKFLIEAPSDYPPGLRVLLSLIPKHILDKYEWLICPLVDLCHIMLVFGFVYYFTHNLLVAILAQIIYLSAPLTIMENSNLTTRSLASFLFTLTFLGMLGFSMTGKAAFFIFACLMVVILLLSHRMSVQALFFVIIFFSVYEKNIFYFLIFGLGVLIAIIISRGFYLKIFRGHLAMLEYWRKHIKYRYAHEVRGLPEKGAKSNDMVFNLYQRVRSAPFMAVLTANPFVLLVIAFIFLKKFNFGFDISYFKFPSFLIDKFAMWSLFLLIVGVAIRSIRFIEFMGEGERYMEYASFPIAIIGALTVYSGFQSPYFNLILIGFLSFVVLGGLLPAFYIQQKVIIHDKERSITESLWKIFDYINHIDDEVRMMCIPQLMSTSVMYFTKAKVLCTDNSLAHITDLADVLPVIKKPLKEIFKKYRINYLLVNEHYVSIEELNLELKQTVKKEKFFHLLKVDLAKNEN
jgi:hypothetical protein